MRSWNFVTLDQISQRVTTSSSGHPSMSHAAIGRPRVRYMTPVMVLSAAILLAPSQRFQVQPAIASSEYSASIPIGAVESSESSQPPFIEEFGEFFSDDFFKHHRSMLESIAATGSSFDSEDKWPGVISAVYADEAHWNDKIKGAKS